MTNEDFQKIATKLDEILNTCLEVKNTAPDKSTFEQLTIKQANILSDKARNLQSVQDKLFHDELYHLIGMGQLTPLQEIVILNLFKRLCETRPYIKAIATYIPCSAPNIPEKTKYNCKVLEVKLTYNTQEEEQ